MTRAASQKAGCESKELEGWKKSSEKKRDKANAVLVPDLIKIGILSVRT